jgi:hypothetical protein
MGVELILLGIQMFKISRMFKISNEIKFTSEEGTITLDAREDESRHRGLRQGYWHRYKPGCAATIPGISSLTDL